MRLTRLHHTLRVRTTLAATPPTPGKADLETLEILSQATLEHLDVDAKNEKNQRAVDVMR
jgi:hypothetical protein